VVATGAGLYTAGLGGGVAAAFAAAANFTWCSVTIFWMAGIRTFSAFRYSLISASVPFMVLFSAKPSTRSMADRINRSDLSGPRERSRVLIMLVLKLIKAWSKLG
jgi:hypothetical protein